MKAALGLEVHFHDQEHVSVILESDGGEHEKFAEILLSCAFALRHLANLGGDEVGSSLGHYLLNVTPERLVGLAGKSEEARASLVSYQGAPGRKRFTARLVCDGARVSFRLDPHGFGLFGRGLGFYSPTSVVMLLQFLVERRLLDEEFILALANATSACGHAMADGEVRVGSDLRIAERIAVSVAGEMAGLSEHPMSKMGGELTQIWSLLQTESGAMPLANPSLPEAVWERERMFLDLATIWMGIHLAQAFSEKFRAALIAYLNAVLRAVVHNEQLFDNRMQCYLDKVQTPPSANASTRGWEWALVEVFESFAGTLAPAFRDALLTRQAAVMTHVVGYMKECSATIPEPVDIPDVRGDRGR